jgi:hypothetical protein
VVINVLGGFTGFITGVFILYDTRLETEGLGCPLLAIKYSANTKQEHCECDCCFHMIGFLWFVVKYYKLK